MTLRTKLSLVIIFDIIATAVLVGVLSFRQSKQELEQLARELLHAQTDYAYTLCEKFHALNGEPTDELARAIHDVRIGKEGYIFVFSTEEPGRARLVIHPTDVGKYIEDFHHIQQILGEIDIEVKKGVSRHGHLLTYTQGTDAKGRQGERKIGYYIYFAPWKWVLMASGYESDIYGSTESVRQRVIEVIGIVGFVSLVLINIAVIRMFRPMRQLISVTKEVAAGNLDATIPVNATRDEISGLADHFNKMLSGLKQNTRVWQELEIARRLQREMLPQRQPQLPGAVIEAQSIPANEVGGDFYDIIPLDENRFAIVIGDVSGKGISGAIGMSSAMSALRFAADMRQTTDEILQLANRRLVRDIQRTMFVAVFLGIYDRRARKLSYTNAGQTMPILLRKAKAEFLAQSDADRFPLGIRPDVRFQEQTFDIQSGDTLICYTDGIVELADEKNGTGYQPFGFDRFKDAIEHNANGSLPDMLKGLISSAEQFAGSVDHTDDITLVILKFS